MFTHFKVARLLSYMKTVVRNPDLVRRESQECDIDKRLKIEKEFNSKLSIIKLFIKGYELGRMKNRVRLIEKLENQDKDDSL